MFLKMQFFQDFGFFFAQNWSQIFVKLVLDELVIGNNKPTQDGQDAYRTVSKNAKNKITKLAIQRFLLASSGS